MTGRQHIAWHARARRLRDLSLAEALGERFGAVLDRPARELSKGNKQKIGLILAFMSLPDLLVLDEPTSGLDPLVRSEFGRLAREVAAAGRTVFWSSHELDEVQRLADRVAIIKNGRLIATETVERLRASTPRTMRARFAGPIDPALFAGLDGVSVTACGGDTIQLEVTGAIGPVLRVIAGHDPVDLTSARASLDELFLAYYREPAAAEVADAR
jgi:ABC-2 type transport system ATP-binding protein